MQSPVEGTPIHAGFSCKSTLAPRSLYFGAKQSNNILFVKQTHGPSGPRISIKHTLRVRVCLFRGGTGLTLGGKIAHPRRGSAYRSKHRQNARPFAATTELGNRLKISERDGARQIKTRQALP
jgi:hypothetical protein